jgi:hypothetical protein
MSFFNKWKALPRPPPLTICGLKVQLTHNQKIKKDEVLFVVHPDHFDRVRSELAAGYLDFLKTTKSNGHIA